MGTERPAFPSRKPHANRRIGDGDGYRGILAGRIFGFVVFGLEGAALLVKFDERKFTGAGNAVAFHVEDRYAFHQRFSVFRVFQPTQPGFEVVCWLEGRFTIWPQSGNKIQREFQFLSKGFSTKKTPSDFSNRFISRKFQISDRKSKTGNLKMVGAVRFELTTSCTRNKRASQATLRPDISVKQVARPRRERQC